MIKARIDKDTGEFRALLAGSYVDNLAELIALVYGVCDKLASEKKLDKKKMIKDVLEVAMEDLKELVD